MTQELIDKLIDHYENTISKIKKTRNLKEIRLILVETETRLGICSCALEIFKQCVYSDKWINNKSTKSYIAEYPIAYTSKKEIIQLLQIRVDTMKQFPN